MEFKEEYGESKDVQQLFNSLKYIVSAKIMNTWLNYTYNLQKFAGLLHSLHSMATSPHFKLVAYIFGSRTISC